MIRAHTYSVVMRDPASGRLGVGVQSHWFNVGRIVPWVRAGVGAVATQSIAEPLYGPRGLDLMAAGLPAGEAMGRLLAEDDERDLRQLGFVDHRGGTAAHTGARCIAHASHVVGDGWTVQANIMRSDRVVTAMAATAATMAATDSDLAERLMLVLEAAESSGGDLRGSHSAAIVVAGDDPIPVVDLRVEDHPDPIGELRRVLGVHRAYEQMESGDRALAAGDDSLAAQAYAAAAAAVASPAVSGAEVSFWQAVTMASIGRAREARTIFEQAVESNPDLMELLERLVPAGLVAASVAATLRGSVE